jgi:hypothetical protein
MMTQMNVTEKQVVQIRLRPTETASHSDVAAISGCRVILLDESARARAAAKRKPAVLRFPDPDNLTAA